MYSARVSPRVSPDSKLPWCRVRSPVWLVPGAAALCWKNVPAAERAFGERMEKAFALRAELRSLPRPDTIVCRCEDVTFGSLHGYTGWTDAKLQTRCGMGPCQSRICGTAVEFLLGWRNVSVRQPLFPVPFQAFCSG